MGEMRSKMSDGEDEEVFQSNAENRRCASLFGMQISSIWCMTCARKNGAKDHALNWSGCLRRARGNVSVRIQSNICICARRPKRWCMFQLANERKSIRLWDGFVSDANYATVLGRAKRNEYMISLGDPGFPISIEWLYLYGREPSA